MKESKLFKDMTAKEQQVYLKDFTHFTDEKLGILTQYADAWTEARVKSFEEGLYLLQAFSYCRDFVQQTLYWKDFSRRVNYFLFLLEKVRKEIKAGRFMTTTAGETIVATEKNKGKRGRPSRRKEPVETVSDDNMVKNIADTIDNLQAGKKQTEENKSADTPPASLTPLQVISNQIAGTERLSLKELSWLFTPETQEKVNRVQFLRATVTAESEKAKALAEINADSELIKPHSEATTTAMEEVLSIYDIVDSELAEIYYRLSEDNDFGGYKTALELRGGSFTSLMEVLLPYYEKKGGKEFGATLKSNDQLKAEKEEADKAAKERSQKIHKARTYILRSDVTLTAERCKKMKEYLQECRNLGYENIEGLEKAVSEAEKQISCEANASESNLFAALNDTDEMKEDRNTTKKTKKK